MSTRSYSVRHESVYVGGSPTDKKILKCDNEAVPMSYATRFKTTPKSLTLDGLERRKGCKRTMWVSSGASSSGPDEMDLLGRARIQHFLCELILQKCFAILMIFIVVPSFLFFLGALHFPSDFLFKFPEHLF